MTATKGDAHESFHVLQLYLTFAAPGWAAHTAGRVLCRRRRDGHCRLATGRLHATKLAHLKHARYEWRRYRGDGPERAVQSERPVLLRAAQKRGRHHELHCCHERSEEHTSELQSPCNLVC